jgi:hypothetical protein
MSAVVCSNCKEKNNPGFQYCWKCKTFLNNPKSGNAEESFEERWAGQIKLKLEIAAYAGLVVALCLSLFGWQMSGQDTKNIPYVFITFFAASIPSMIVFSFIWIFKKKNQKQK